MIEENRGTGRTTALAFKYLYEAMTIPNLPVKIFDHSGTRAHDEKLLGQIQSLVGVLNLKGFIFRRCPPSMVFGQYPENYK